MTCGAALPFWGSGCCCRKSGRQHLTTAAKPDLGDWTGHIGVCGTYTIDCANVYAGRNQAVQSHA